MGSDGCLLGTLRREGNNDIMSGRTISTQRVANKPVSIGRHRTVIEKIDWKTSSSGNEYLAVRLRVTEGVDNGKSVFDNWMLDGSMRVKLENALDALGVPEEMETIDPESLVGGEIDVLIEHDTWNDETRARVKQIYRTDAMSGDGEMAAQDELPW